MSRRIVSCTIIAMMVLLAGSACGHKASQASAHRYVHPPQIVTPANAPWKRMFRDWFDNGRIDRRYSCAVAQSAVAHLPTDAPEIGFPVRVYARKAC